MVESKYFLTICIPSYNRPETLKRALESVDAKKYADEIQIVICEDCAPKRLEVRAVADEFKTKTKYAFKYVENEVNLGHGKNWRHCAHEAEGEYLTYIGDDDVFVPGKLDLFIEWLHKHNNLGYVLRAYQTMGRDGKIADHKYYKEDRFYEPGVEAYLAFFMKSNLMSGYTIKREYTYDYEESDIDYTVLYQMYLMSQVCLKYPSGYCNIVFVQDMNDGISYFGTNEVEKKFFTPGVKVENNLSYIDKFYDVTNFIDKKCGLDSTVFFKKEFAKYSSYPTFLRFRAQSKKAFRQCKRDLERRGLNKSGYFYLYYYSILLFGTSFCNKVIRFIRKVIGGRPEL